MVSRIVYIGGEAAAAGYRLAGLSVRVPASGAETSTLLEELGRAALVLISAQTGANMARAELERALAAANPLAVIVPDGRELPADFDIAGRVRMQLGVGGT